MKEAVAAAMERGPLPGQPGSALVEASRPCQTHLQILRDAAALAEQRGVVGMRVPGGRALIAVSIEKTLAEQEWGKWFDTYQSERRRTLKRAGLTSGAENISLRNAEVAGGPAPRNAPFGCYPLPPRDCALMICDFLAFEVVFDPEALVGPFARHGIDAEVTFNPLSPRVGQREPVYALSAGVDGSTFVSEG